MSNTHKMINKMINNKKIKISIYFKIKIHIIPQMYMMKNIILKFKIQIINNQIKTIKKCIRIIMNNLNKNKLCSINKKSNQNKYKINQNKI